MIPVDEQLAILMRGVEDVVTYAELQQKLAHSYATGTPLRVKLGIDPTKNFMTLGHTVPLRKLRQFQDLGHQAVLIIGDYTAMVGDPTDRKEARAGLTHAETQANAQTYLEQAAVVLDPQRLEVHRNSEWLAPMTFADVLLLASKITVARMLERQDFAARYAEGRPISIHEFFYPLMQGYDSVAVRADVELGATEQKFNLLMGRELQRDAGQVPQVCLMNPVVEGLDGVRKMGKSEGNYIAINDTPADIFGKVMSIPDHLIPRYFTFFTQVDAGVIQQELAAMAAGKNPRDVKMCLAREIVRTYKGSDAIAAAEAHFVRLFQQRDLPADLPEFAVPPSELDAAGCMRLDRLLLLAGLAQSTSEARRQVAQGGVALDDTRSLDVAQPVSVHDGQVLRVGKRRFVRLRRGQ